MISLDSTERIWLFVYLALSLAILGSNSLLLATLLTQKRLYNATNIFVISLSASDLLVGLIILPLLIVGEFYRQTFPPRKICHLYSVFVMFNCVTAVCSVYSILGIAFERYRVIVQPFKPRLDQGQCLAGIGSLWITAFVVSCVFVAQIEVKNDLRYLPNIFNRVNSIIEPTTNRNYRQIKNDTHYPTLFPPTKVNVLNLADNSITFNNNDSRFELRDTPPNYTSYCDRNSMNTMLTRINRLAIPWTDNSSYLQENFTHTESKFINTYLKNLRFELFDHNYAQIGLGLDNLFNYDNNSTSESRSKTSIETEFCSFSKWQNVAYIIFQLSVGCTIPLLTAMALYSQMVKTLWKTRFKLDSSPSRVNIQSTTFASNNKCKYKNNDYNNINDEANKLKKNEQKKNEQAYYNYDSLNSKIVANLYKGITKKKMNKKKSIPELYPSLYKTLGSSKLVPIQSTYCKSCNCSFLRKDYCLKNKFPIKPQNHSKQTTRSCFDFGTKRFATKALSLPCEYFINHQDTNEKNKIKDHKKNQMLCFTYKNPFTGTENRKKTVLHDLNSVEKGPIHHNTTNQIIPLLILNQIDNDHHKNYVEHILFDVPTAPFKLDLTSNEVNLKHSLKSSTLFSRKNTRAIRLLICIMIMYLSCFVPFYILSLVELFYPLGISKLIYNIHNVVTLTGHWANVLLYTYFSKSFRNGFVNMIRHSCLGLPSRYRSSMTKSPMVDDYNTLNQNNNYSDKSTKHKYRYEVDAQYMRRNFSLEDKNFHKKLNDLK
ncbi:unnamed protein product [Gordionus sp. m RMFG-2023]